MPRPAAGDRPQTTRRWVPCNQMVKKGVCNIPGCEFSHTLVTCDVCSVMCTSQKSLADHVRSKKHRAAAAARDGAASGPLPAAFLASKTHTYHMVSSLHKKKERVYKFMQAELQRQAVKGGIELPPQSSFEIDAVPFSKATASNRSYRLGVQINNTDRESSLILFPDMVNGTPRSMRIECETKGFPRVIKAGSIDTIHFLYTPLHMGFAQIVFRFNFQSKDGKEFSISRTLKALIGDKDILDAIRPTVPFDQEKHRRNLNLTKSMKETHANNIVVAPGLDLAHFEWANPLGMYKVPRSMRECLLREEANKTQSSLYEFLSSFVPKDMASNDAHSELYNNLLWAEEIQMEVDIKQYSLKDAVLTFQAGGKLGEKRPSVIRGDKVLVKEANNPSAKCFEGVCSKVEELNVILSFDSSFNRSFIAGQKYSVEFTFNRVALRRMHQAIEPRTSMFSGMDHDFAKLNIRVEALLAPGKISAADKFKFSAYNRSVTSNAEQRRAISIITQGLHAPFPFLLFGPPGTGKTVTLVEAMKQIFFRDNRTRLLVCAPSNSAADLLLERLATHIGKREMLRLNAFFRTQPSSWDGLKDYVYREPHSQNEYDVPPYELLSKFRVVVTTCCSASMLHGAGLPDDFFTHVFVDESGQGLEPEVMIPLNTFKYPPTTRFILAGDHKQLGPILHSKVATYFGLGVSLLERLMGYLKLRHHPRLKVAASDLEQYQKAMSVLSVKLLNNYRSHPDILSVPNALFYRSELRPCADEMQANQYLTWPELPNDECPLMFYHVDGKDEREGNSPSWFNVPEIMMVCELVEKLRDSRGMFRPITGADVGIITPYNRQAEKLRKVLARKGFENTTVGSVDAFQGQERKVIIISTVRSNPDNLAFDTRFALGFVADPKRFNVAITRAKSLLLIVGNANILLRDPSWRAWITFAYERSACKNMPAAAITEIKKIQAEGSAAVSGLAAGNDDDELEVVQVNAEAAWRDFD
ncbi:P-loop containing nucleoside triphosphate hydrolase protein [Entophlyctis helioformis]|nr:P-loop containing nucleoside triphosphate hydrolase protein [Entophlyctis helioformis]